MISPAVWERNLGTIFGASFFFTLLTRRSLTPRVPHAQSPRNSLPAFSPLCNGPHPDLRSFHMWNIAKASWMIFLPPVWLCHWSIFHIPDGDSFRNGKFGHVISLPHPTFRMKSNCLAKHTKPFRSISSVWSTIPHLRPYCLPHHTELCAMFQDHSYLEVFECVPSLGVPWLTSAPNSCFLEKRTPIVSSSGPPCPPHLPRGWQVPVSQGPSRSVFTLISALTALFYNELFQAVMFINHRACHSHWGFCQLSSPDETPLKPGLGLNHHCRPTVLHNLWSKASSG